MDKTILKLTDLYFDPAMGKYLTGQIIGTHDLDSYGVVVSDLTLDTPLRGLRNTQEHGVLALNTRHQSSKLRKFDKRCGQSFCANNKCGHAP
jgi:hypothetical protein